MASAKVGEDSRVLDLKEHHARADRHRRDRDQLAGRPAWLERAAGIRIAGPNDGSSQLDLAAAEAPIEGDQVVEQDGARVFLEPGAARMLDDMVLDAAVQDDGSVRFTLRRQ